MTNIYDDIFEQEGNAGGIDPKFLKALSMHESGGDPNIISPVGAIGLGQFMPDTARELGIDPYDPRQAIHGMVLYLKPLFDKYGNDYRRILSAYNAGEGNMDRAIDEDWSETRNHYEKVMENYAELGGQPLMTSGVWSMANASQVKMNNIFEYNDDDEHGVYRPKDWWGETKDSFLNEWYNNGTVALIRNAVNMGDTASNGIVFDNWKPNEADLEAIQTTFEGDLETQHFLMSNAKSQAHLAKLIKMKQEDIARQKNVDQAGWGLKSIGGLMGMLLDPLNLVPVVGQEAILAKLSTRLGSKVLAEIGAKKAVQLAEIGVTNGLVNMADQRMAEVYGGYKPDYTSAFLLGSAMGAGAKYLNSTMGDHKANVKTTKEMDNVARHIEANSERALMQTADIVQPPKHSEVDLTALYKKTGATTEQELAQYLRANKGTKIYDMAHKAYNADGRLTDNQFHTKLQELAEGRVAENPINIKAEEVEINGVAVPRNQQNFIAEAITDDNHIFNPPERTPEIEVEKVVNDLIDEDIPFSEKPEALEVEYHDALFSEELAFGKMGVTAPEEVLKETQGKKGVIAKELETNKYLGNNFGRMANSVSNTLRHFANKYLSDPRQRGNNIGLNIESAKQVAKQDYNISLERMNGHFKDWYFSNTRKYLSNFSEASRDFNTLLSNAFHEKYRDGKHIDHYPKAIQEAVKELKYFRELDVKKNHRAGVIDKTVFNNEGELWRRIDTDKLDYLRTKFVNEDALRNYLRKYFETFIIRDQLPDPSTDIRGLAEEMADYTLKADRNRFGDEDLGELIDTKGDKKLAYYKSRIPVDTGGYLPINAVGGAVDKNINDGFSFDVDLRDTNVINHMHYVANRSSGAIALKQHLGIDDIGMMADQLDMRAKTELAEAVEKGWISLVEAEQEILDLHQGIHYLTGARIFEDAIKDTVSTGDRLKNLILDASYAMNGVNFGLSALAEHAGAVSQVGARALTHFVPYLHDFIHKIKYSKHVSAKQLKEFRRQKIGTFMTDTIWFDPRIRNQNYLENYSTGMHLQTLGQAEDGVSLASKLTSTLSQVQGITNHSIQSIQADIIPDMLAWAEDDFSSVFRKNLFSDESFKRVGIDDVQSFKSDLLGVIKDLGNKEDEKSLIRAMENWEERNPTNYAKFHAFLNQKSTEAILQPNWSSGNTRATGFIPAVLMQFKNFSRMALNSHLMRGMENWRREDTIQTMATALSGGMLWAIRMRAYADYTYEDKEKAKQNFLDKTLTAENLLLAGITRSSILSSSSFGLDAYQILTGKGTNTRTTVDRNEWGDDLDLLGETKERLQQFPVFSMGMNLFDGTKTGLEILGQLEQDQLIQGDQARTLHKLIPLERYSVFQAVWAGFADMANEERKRNRKPQTNKDFAMLDYKESKDHDEKFAKDETEVVRRLIKNAPEKRNELVEAVAKINKKELKGRKADTLTDEELLKFYFDGRKRAGRKQGNMKQEENDDE